MLSLVLPARVKSNQRSACDLSLLECLSTSLNVSLPKSLTRRQSIIGVFPVTQQLESLMDEFKQHTELSTGGRKNSREVNFDDLYPSICRVICDVINSTSIDSTLTTLLHLILQYEYN